MIDTKNRNVLVLAYIGDAIYEIIVREYLINQSFDKVNELQKKSIEYVSARKQSEFVKKLLDNNFFTLEEIDKHEDFVIAVYVLVQDMYDNRSYYVDKNNLNKVVETILGMHAVNLI